AIKARTSIAVGKLTQRLVGVGRVNQEVIVAVNMAVVVEVALVEAEGGSASGGRAGLVVVAINLEVVVGVDLAVHVGVAVVSEHHQGVAWADGLTAEARGLRAADVLDVGSGSDGERGQEILRR